MLRTENANMYILNEEGKQMRRQLDMYKEKAAIAHSKAAESGPARERLAEAEAEVKALRQQLAESQAAFQVLQTQQFQAAGPSSHGSSAGGSSAGGSSAGGGGGGGCGTPPGSSSLRMGGFGGGGGAMERPQTAKEVLDEFEGFDDEIVDLIRRNETGLQQIKKVACAAVRCCAPVKHLALDHALP
jgi:hypothetical protein